MITRFARQVFDVLAPLHKDGFAPAKLWAGERFASLVRRLCDDVCAYLFVNDRRAGNSDLEVVLWVAPTDAPDEGLDRLCVGYRMLIGGTFDVEDEFFQNCVARVSNLLPVLPVMRDAVVCELNAPPFKTRRLSVYRVERRAYRCLLAVCADRRSVVAQSVMEIAVRSVRSQASFDELEERCERLGAALIESDLLDDDIQSFYEGDSKRLGGSLFGHIYIDALTRPELFGEEEPDAGSKRLV